MDVTYYIVVNSIDVQGKECIQPDNIFERDGRWVEDSKKLNAETNSALLIDSMTQPRSMRVLGLN